MKDQTLQIDIKEIHARDNVISKSTLVTSDIDLKESSDIKKGTIQIQFFKYVGRSLRGFSDDFPWVALGLINIPKTPEWVKKKYPKDLPF